MTSLGMMFVLGAAVDGADGDDGWFRWFDLSADDRLEIKNREGGEDDGVNRAVRPGAMAAFAADGDGERGGAGEHGAGAIADGAGGSLGDAVEGEAKVGLGEAGVKAGVKHGAGASDRFFGGLADEEDGAGPFVFVVCEPGGRWR